MDSSLAFEIGSTLCFQIAIVIAAAAGLQRWLGDARAGCRLWTVCFLSILVIVAAAWLLPHRRLFDFPLDGRRESLLRIVTWQTRIAIALMTIWLTGLTVSLARRGWLCLQLNHFLKHRCVAIEADALLERLQLQAPPKIEILISDEIQGPFCWQLHRPLIVLPKALIDEDDTTLRHVLLHEIEHLRTQHPMQHFLQGVCSTLLWFHPAMWMAARGADLTREFLCDEAAAIGCGKFGAYLQTLAKVAERCENQSCTAVPRGTLAFGNQKSTLIRRSERLVKIAQRPQQRPSKRPAIAIGALIVVGVLVQQVWLPTNARASSRSEWSPWPSWTAEALHNSFDLQLRDFERFENSLQMHELLPETQDG
ncbi:Methicillin resistance mecR1 protein [Novipirellula galeiformis]|uniref:Methicillin resistance mecR1 protein n=1 Tax=Novipirellula galeiformis TaxID=2528004 RepID=A0A5C6CAQ7_9BACT|nr:M56 family metallopeptidase [Novipirellula galeiformis]TWU21165.1 Methicillin resistance mecR1 protein [Novipirellula galeiformis]